MSETIIVTLCTGGFSGDYELPSAVAMRELAPRLLQVLRKKAPGYFANWSALSLQTRNGKDIPLVATLRDMDVVTGDYLEILRR